MIGTYAGLRPLLDTGDGAHGGCVSRARRVESPSGVISVVGGKLTTYRRMAQDVVDLAVAVERPAAAGRAARGTCRSSGAGESRCRRLRSTGLPPSLVARYGAEAPNVSRRGRTPDRPVADGIDVTRAEFEYAVTHEGALAVDDMLDRRTRIGLVRADRDRVVGVAEEILSCAMGGSR